ncbi:MAG: SUMF1/EgtB/PvdO family nonheme iron enzyme [Myxococcota bacterium]
MRSPTSTTPTTGTAVALDDALEVLADAGKAGDTRGIASVGGVVADWLGVPEVAADRYGVWLRLDIQGVPLRMRWCPPGRYLRGAPLSEPGRRDWEPVPHQITLTHGFWLGEAPVVRELWHTVRGHGVHREDGPTYPVEGLDWPECANFTELLAVRIDALVRLRFRLPTDAEWEYACRAGGAGAQNGPLDTVAWFAHNSGQHLHPVGTKRPNPWGIHDMLGNVWEWCADGVDGPRRIAEPLVDPISEGRLRIRRGGSWSSPPHLVRAACYYVNSPALRSRQLGFRLAADVTPSPT